MTTATLCGAVLFLSTTASAATIDVKAGEDLQAAINAAQPGDTIVLAAGATFTGNFVLPVKPGSAYITIRTAADSRLPQNGERVQPGHAPLLAKIHSGNNGTALSTAPGAHHWRLLLLELHANNHGYGEIIQLGDGTSAQNQQWQVPYAIELDRLYIHGHPLIGQKRGVALNAAQVTIRNCYISDIKAIGMDTQAIGGWNGPGPYVIENNYLEAAGENVMFGGADPSIPGLVPDGITFRYNHVSRPATWRDPIVPTPTGVSASLGSSGSLSAGTYTYQVVARRPVATLAMARSTASVEATAVVPASGSASVTVRWTPVADATEYLVYRTGGGGQQYWGVIGTSFVDTGAPGTSGAAPTTPGDQWMVKNLFELKNARNVVIEGNTFENNWLHGQSGFAILFTPRNQSGGCAWCVVENVTFHANVIRSVAGGISILGDDDIFPSQRTTNIRITQNLVYDLTQGLGGHGWFMMIGRGPQSVTVDHNTIDGDGWSILYISGPEQVPGFQFTNNAARHNAWGINGSDYSYGNDIITNYFPGAVFVRNWLQGGDPSRYPADNFFSGSFASAFVDLVGRDYHAVNGGVLWRAATDGSDIGAAIDMVMQLSAAATGRSTTTTPPPAPTNLRVQIK